MCFISNSVPLLLSSIIKYLIKSSNCNRVYSWYVIDYIVDSINSLIDCIDIDDVICRDLSVDSAYNKLE